LLWQGGVVIGRYNFTLVDESVADLGYRLAQSQTGRGIATLGLGMALAKAKTALNLSRVIAQTTLNNLGSIRVMEKCGFVRTGTNQGAAELHGQKVDLIGFELCP
ncbi:MAG TPA: N-acetyltransferase, partial [Devosia sp.]|nr:N-acetyltransferase [Devosia sp.]